MYSLIRLYFQNDTSVNSDQLSVHFHPRLTLGIQGATLELIPLYGIVRDTRGGFIDFNSQPLCVTILIDFSY